jgi:hypothetical protein
VSKIGDEDTELLEVVALAGGDHDLDQDRGDSGDRSDPPASTEIALDPLNKLEAINESQQICDLHVRLVLD